MKKRLQGSFCLLLTTIIWGSAFVAQSVGADLVGPFTFQAVRCALAVLGLLPLIWVFDRLQKGSSFAQRWQNKALWKAGILCGIPLFLAANLQQIGLGDTDAGKSAFLTAMYIVIVPLLGLLRKRKPGPLLIVSVALAVLGLYFLSWAGSGSLTAGDSALIGCAFMFAVQIELVDCFAKGLDALRLNCIQSLVCAVLSAAVMFLTEQPSLCAIASCWVPLSYAGFLSMGLAYSLQILGQKHLEPAPAALIMSLESVFAALFGWLLLKEQMTSSEGLGCGLMLIAVILSQIPSKKAP